MDLTTSAPPFDVTDPHSFQALKADLRQRLKRSLPDSEQVVMVALSLVEICRSGAFQRDALPDLPSRSKSKSPEPFWRWLKATLDIGPEQGRKYLRVGQELTLLAVSGQTLGIEVLYQIAIADVRLRPVLWALAQEERLAATALAAGRKAGERSLREDVEEVVRAAARRQAKREEEDQARRATPRTPVQRLDRALGQATRQIHDALQTEVMAGTEAEQRQLRERLAELRALCERLEQRLPEEPQPEPTPELRPEDVLEGVAARAAAHQPVVLWLHALPARKREMMTALLAGVLVGACTLPTLRAMLDQKVPQWEVAAPPEPCFRRWCEALLCPDRGAMTALVTLAAADAVQLLQVLPRLLERIDRLRGAEAEIRLLAARYGATVAYLREPERRDEE